MRKVLFTACAVGLIATGIATMASADANNWTLRFSPSSGGNWFDPTDVGNSALALSSTVATVTDSEAVRDPRDGAPPAAASGSPAVAAWYRPGWMKNDGTDSTNWPWAFSADYRTPLTTVPNLVKTWHDMVVWTLPGFSATSNVIHLFVTTGITATSTAPASINGQAVQYKLIMTRAPQGYVPGQNSSTMPTGGLGTPESPYEFLLGAPQTGNAQNGRYLLGDIILPAAGTESSNPVSNAGGPLVATQTAGYRFDLVTPEPGSILVLASGLTGLVGLVSRRRKA